eukprot:968521-Amorphochlora_amoeboformis.AAC.1
MLGCGLEMLGRCFGMTKQSCRVLENLVTEDIAKAERDKKSKAMPIQCISLAWSPNGNVLFAGYTDNTIRVWQVMAEQTM